MIRSPLSASTVRRAPSRFAGPTVVLVAAASVLLASFGAALSAAEPSAPAEPAAARPIRVLFLGDRGPHRPSERAPGLIRAMAARGIQVAYTEELAVLAAEKLAAFDAILIYANIDELPPEREAALLEYVRSGHGCLPIHCASWCFRNSEAFVRLVGGQFSKHGTGTFRTTVVAPDHPIMRGFSGFESWDETYIHARLTDDRTVLERRPGGEQAPGRTAEDWTWVRDEGAGRVFYTAWGHDRRTWENPGFLDLIERAIRWTTRHDVATAAASAPSARPPFVMPAMTTVPADAPRPGKRDAAAAIPVYPAGARWGTQSEPERTLPEPLPAADSMKHYVTPVGFQLRLFVDETKLGGKPLCMTWDAGGRLWVCLTRDYPNELTPGRGRDRVVVCHDDDADGACDRVTTFAEGLSIPTAIAPYRSGVIVQDGGTTLYLADEDGDFVADGRRELITGWNIRDTHGGVSNIRYGLDNHYYAMQGYNDSTPVIAGEEQPGFKMGFFRFGLWQADLAGATSDGRAMAQPPRVRSLEFLRSTNNNTWGLGISEEGLIFGSTANGNPSEYMPLANRFYERVSGWGPAALDGIADSNQFAPITTAVRQVDHHGGYSAGAGHALYTGRAYPQQWWNRTAFTCGPEGHLVGTFVLTPDGADFTSTSPGNLIASDDEWAAPIMAEVGPDGQVWVIDWYNFIVQHNPTPQGFTTGRGNAYETPLRDKTHGRIYRVVYVGGEPGSTGPATPPPTVGPADLGKASPKELVAALADPTMERRLTAQRLLVEGAAKLRGDAAVKAALLALVEDESTDPIGLNVGAIHALWTLQGLALVGPDHPDALDAVRGSTDHPSAGVRRNACLVLATVPSEENIARLTDRIGDADAIVQLAALSALSDSLASWSAPSVPPRPAARVESLKVAGTALAAYLDTHAGGLDAWRVDAATSAAAMAGPEFLVAWTGRTGAVPPAAGPVVRRVAEHVARRGVDRDTLAAVTALAAAEPARRGPVLAGLAGVRAAREKLRPTPEAEAAVTELLAELPLTERGDLAKIIVGWDSPVLLTNIDALAADLLRGATDEDAPDARRVDAARQALALAGARPTEAADPSAKPVAARIAELLTPQMPTDLSEKFLGVLEGPVGAAAAPTIARRLPMFTPRVRAAAIRVLLSTDPGATALTEALSTRTASLDELAADQRRQLANWPNEAIRAQAQAVLAAGGALASADRQAVIDSYKVTLAGGSAEAGMAVFRRECAKCHKHGSLTGEPGGVIGPDLTGMVTHPRPELLIHILDPSRSVEGNFRVYQASTVDGLVKTGLLAGESRTTVELLDAEGKRTILERSEIEEWAASPESLMPAGFEKTIPVGPMADLLAFMTTPGRFLPLDLKAVATVDSTKPMFGGTGASPDRLVFDDYATKTVEGVPFALVDPRGGRPNVVLLHGPRGAIPPTMPRTVSLPVGVPAAAVHLLGGVGGWNAQRGRPDGPPAMFVQFTYADGTKEDHPLRDGVELADYIGRFDVPGSTRAFDLDGRQVRYLTIRPRKPEVIRSIQLVKARHESAPIVVAVTVELPPPPAQPREDSATEPTASPR